MATWKRIITSADLSAQDIADIGNLSNTNSGDETQATINALDITEVGTISSGTWEGTDIAAGYIADTAVTPGSYTVSSITVDQQGRITSASSGTAGDANQNAFTTVNPSSGDDVVADSTTDTINFTASGGMTITGTAGTDTINFSSTDTNTDTLWTGVSTNLVASTGRTSLGLGSCATKDVGIGDGDILTSNDAVVDDDFLRINGTEVEGRNVDEVLSDLGIDADIKTLTLAASSTVSGSNTGDQTITLTGDVTGTGTGSFATTIATDAVDIAMLSASGTAGNTTFLRGDNAWVVPPNTMGSGFTVVSTTTGTGTTITQGDSLTLTAGTGITTTGTSDGVVTIACTVTDTNTTTTADVFSALSGDPGGNFVIGNQSSDTATFSGAVTVDGDFLVRGTTTTISTANLEVEDKFVVLGTPDSAYSDDAAAASGGNAGGIGIYTDSAGTINNFAKITWSSTGDLSGWMASNTQASKFPIAAMEFSTDSTVPDGNAAGVGSFHFDSGNDKLYIRTA